MKNVPEMRKEAFSSSFLEGNADPVARSASSARDSAPRPPVPPPPGRLAQAQSQRGAFPPQRACSPGRAPGTRGGGGGGGGSGRWALRSGSGFAAVGSLLRPLCGLGCLHTSVQSDDGAAQGAGGPGSPRGKEPLFLTRRVPARGPGRAGRPAPSRRSARRERRPGCGRYPVLPASPARGGCRTLGRRRARPEAGLLREESRDAPWDGPGSGCAKGGDLLGLQPPSGAQPARLCPGGCPPRSARGEVWEPSVPRGVLCGGARGLSSGR